MTLRRGIHVFTIIQIVAGLSMVCEAQERPLLTRHLREVTVSGQAQLVGRLPPSKSMTLDLVLSLRNQAELSNLLIQLYDPSDPSYRHFLTVPEFTASYGPTREDYDAVVHFAQANGLTIVGGSRDSMDVQVNSSVAKIETAFNIMINVFQHPTENRTFFAPNREPTVNLPFQLWHISGLDNYSIPRPAVRHSPAVTANFAGSCPGNSYCGSDMRAAYYGGTSLTGAGQSVGLLEFYGYNIHDVNTYFVSARQTNHVPIIGISTDGSSLGCLSANGCDDTEQILDITQAASMAPGMRALNVYVGNSDTAILSAMSRHSPLDKQLSSSWTWSPSDPRVDDPYFEKFAAQGQSIFQAAGDSGAYAADSTAVYPADDAYVTAVG
ncbi:MAG: hypothetical protein JO166_09500, partial [Deltaproteobacteria bacterium]|nr:hypothetical protein [Deltaproteobacteria bacterium]